MPVQITQSSFAKKLGSRVAAANAEHRDKPIDIGIQRLPAGIRNGVAKLVTMITKEYPDDKNGPNTKGCVFFRAAAVVVSPTEHDGCKVLGLQTSTIISLCDMPAKGQRKAKSFSENWYEFQNLFKLLGIAPPNETPQSDPTGQRVEAYYFAAMKALCDPQRPVYISFSTRGWTPPPSPLQPKPEELVFETWHGLATWNDRFDPAAGVTVLDSQPAFDEMAPTHTAPTPQTATQGNGVKPPTSGPSPQYQPPQDPENREDVVNALVEVAMNDPDGATETGKAAAIQLEELAWENGWTKEQTVGADDWAAVGEMALSNPADENEEQGEHSEHGSAQPKVGDRFNLARRDKQGNILTNGEGKPFPLLEVEVLTVDRNLEVCTVKTVKDDKVLTNLKSKNPATIKFEWLE